MVCQARALNLPINEEQLKAKARLVAHHFDEESKFQGSNGWLQKFKQRYQMSSKVLSGESRSMDQGVVDEWLNQLEALTLGCDPDDIWNCDETDRGLPNRSLCTKDDDGKNVN